MTDERVNGRTCVTCACAFVIEPPRVPTAEQLQADPNIVNRKPVRVCRLNPPTVIFTEVMTPQGPRTVQRLAQAPTDDYFSCWHWKEPGTLPGDDMPPYGEDQVSGVKVPGLVVS
jgi:hypothetical protein